MKFYLGTHRPSWLARTDVPLFLSRSVLKDRKTFPRAVGQWALDSGGFTALHKTGRYEFTVEQWIGEIDRYSTEIGGMCWAAPMDWMCEPSVLDKTGLTVKEHQRRTVENYCLLKESRVADLVIPVLQGWTIDQYFDCWQMYTQVGWPVWADPVVGVGSVCRRGQDAEISRILREIKSWGVSIHAFGVRSQVLQDCSDILTSTDSMAWSFAGRHMRLNGCHGHKNEANCLRWALLWQQQQLNRTSQLRLEEPCAA